MVSESQSAGDQRTRAVHVLAVTAGSGYASAFVDRLAGDEEFDVTAVPSVNDAVEFLSSTDDVECVVSDADTPEVDGVTFLQMVRVQHPDLPFFLFTSEADGSVAARAMSARVTDYFVGERLEQDRDRLADMIERAVDYYRLQCEDPDRGTRVRDVLDALPDMVCIAREDAVVHTNAEAAAMLGLDDAEDLVDHPLSTLFADDDAGGLAPLDAIAAGERAVDRSEAMMVDADGDPVPVDLTAARIVWEDEPAVLVVARNLTRRRVLEGRLDEALRINEVLRRVDRAVINASSREELDAAICETLAAADPYVMAWIGEQDDESGRVTPRASAGEGLAYLDDVTITVGDGPRSDGPTGTAVETGEVTVVQQTTDDPTFEPWRDAALEHGFRSSAAVPLRHDGVRYGVLNVYADREDAFDEDEVGLLDELGRDVGHALAGLDARQSLEERVKEMEGVREATQLLHRSPEGRPLSEIFADFVDLVPPAFQLPDRTAVRLRYGDVEATTEGYVDGGEGIAATGETEGGETVELDVVYTDGADPAEVGPFLQEETDLLDTFVGLVTAYLDRRAYVDEIERVKERFRAFVESATDAITVLDEQGDIQYASPAIERVLGGSPDDYLGKNVASDLVHPEDREAAIAMFAEVVEAGPSEKISTTEEFRLEHADGGWVWVESTVSNAETDLGYVTVTRDVTERKEREEELARLKERFRAFIENASDIITIIDDSGTVQYMSSAVEKILGEGAEKFVGRNVFTDLIHPDDAAEAMETFSATVTSDGSGRETATQELRLRHGNGDWVWAETTVSNRRTEDGFVTVTREITERRERERELGRSEERLSLALEIAEAGVWDYDLETGELAWDESQMRLYGVDPGSFEETYQGFIDRVHEEDRALVEEGIENALEGRERFDEEFRVWRDDGEMLWVHALSRVFTEDGDATRMIGVNLDVTEQKERETQLRVTDRLLRHNLRNDMNVILGHAETLHEETTEALRPHAQTIVETGDELLAKADKERDIIEVLTNEPTVRADDVAAIVRRTVETMRDAHPDATISLDAPEESVGVVSDRFGQAIEELLENGLLHSDREAPTVTVSVDVDEDTVTARVADDGPGIPEKDIAVLSEEHETPLEHGSGIGLWLVHWIVRRSDGTLDFEDNEPRGTVARITVPRPDADVDNVASHANDGSGHRER